MPVLRVCAPLGGGIGDVVYDFLKTEPFRKLASLVEDYKATIRIYTQCHCDGTEDIFLHHPHVHEVISEPWHPPTVEDVHRWNHPTEDGYIPISRNDLLHQWGVRALTLQPPTLHYSSEELALVARLTAQRPCIVAQPYAGLSDRDGFDAAALARLAADLHALHPGVNFLVLGKNHDRGHKYSREECPDLPGVTNLIDQLGIRVAHKIVESCDVFVGAHSNLIRTAWDHRKRTALVVPDPLMTRHLPTIDPKYTYGTKYPENRTFTYSFDHGQPRQFEFLDTKALATFLLRG